MRSQLLFAAAAGLFACCGTAIASRADTLTVSTGFDYSTGKYDTPNDTVVWYYPVVLKYEAGSSIFKLTVPYLTIEGTGTVVVDGNIVTADGTQTGIGDAIASATYNLSPGHNAWPLVDITAKIKFATADETKGLGSGENDYILQFDLAKDFPRWIAFGTVGYRAYGDPPGIDYNNILLASAGAGYKLGARGSIGLMYDFRQAAIVTAKNQQELVAYVSIKLRERWKALGYAVRGYSDASPDWGAGTLISLEF